MFVPNCLEIVPGSLADYNTLKHHHYRKASVVPTTQIYKIRGKKEHKHSFPDPISVIVYRQPIPDIRARTIATKGFFHEPASLSDRLRLVNRKIQYIARLITAPEFQKLGFATWLLRDSLERQAVPIVETLTPIDFTNKIFQRQGFRLYANPAPPWYARFKKVLLDIGLTEESFTTPFFVHNRIDKLPAGRRKTLEVKIRNFLRHFRRRTYEQHSIARTAFFLSKLQFPHAYLIWLNPHAKLYTKN